MKSVLALALICFSLLALQEAAEYDVGDIGGWKYFVQDWPNGKSFKAGDVLGEHNVVVVDAAGYNNYTPTPGSKVYNSGYDHITLEKGDNYFLCAFIGHCEGGMKIAVKANIIF